MLITKTRLEPKIRGNFIPTLYFLHLSGISRISKRPLDFVDVDLNRDDILLFDPSDYVLHLV